MSSSTASAEFTRNGANVAQLTLQTLRAGLAVFDDAGRLVEVDRRAVELLSLSSVADLGDRLDHPRWAAVHLDMSPVDRVSDPVRAAIIDGSAPVADVLGVLTSGGDTRWLAITVVPVALADGTTAGAMSSLVEVTGIVRDRAAVDWAEHLGRAAFDNVSSPICLVGDGGWITDWNRAFAARLDLPDHELIQTPVEKWIVGARGVLERAATGQPVGPVLTRWYDGSDVIVRCWPTTISGIQRWMLELSAVPTG